MNPEDLMEALEQSRDSIAVFTGMRQQFIDSGWSPQGAEQMLIALLTNVLGGAR